MTRNVISVPFSRMLVILNYGLHAKASDSWVFVFLDLLTSAPSVDPRPHNYFPQSTKVPKEKCIIG